MKKILVLALAIVMAFSVVALVACGAEETVEGEYSYENSWTPGQKYGCKVTVSVKNGVITKVVVADDTDTYYNLSSGWADKAKWTNGQKAMVDSFVGLSVKDVNAITVAKTTSGQPDTGSADNVKDPFANLPKDLKVVQDAGAGATQSSGRLILAVQNALSKLGK